MNKIVNIETNKEIAWVEKQFVSFCQTWKTILKWNFTTTAEERIIAPMRALSPAYVRIGGTRSHYVIFQSQGEEKREPFGKQTLIISGED